MSDGMAYPSRKLTFNDRINALVIDANAPAPELRTAYDQLKPTQKQFVDNYVATDDPTKAYLLVFPQFEVAPQKAYPRILELMRAPLVQAAILERQKTIAERIEITAEAVVQEIAKIAFASQKHYTRLTEDGEPVTGDWHNLTDAQWAAIAEISVEEYTEGRGSDARQVKRVKWKLHDKNSALDKLAKKFGIYEPERLQISGPGGGPIQQDVRQVSVAMTPEQAAEHYARSLNDD